MAQELTQKGRYPVRQVCELLGLAPSSYYYRSKQANEQQFAADMKLVAGQHPTYGTRRITHQLQRKPYGYRVNRKRIQRLMRKYGLLRPVKRRKTRTTDSQHPYPRYPNLVMELEINAPDRVWASDITDQFEKRFCVPGCHSGCIYPSDTQLVFEPHFRSTVDPGSAQNGAGKWCTVHPSQRSGCTIYGVRLRWSIAGS